MTKALTPGTEAVRAAQKVILGGSSQALYTTLIESAKKALVLYDGTPSTPADKLTDKDKYPAKKAQGKFFETLPEMMKKSRSIETDPYVKAAMEAVLYVQLQCQGEVTKLATEKLLRKFASLSPLHPGLQPQRLTSPAAHPSL